jgi:hypothetical protein
MSIRNVTERRAQSGVPIEDSIATAVAGIRYFLKGSLDPLGVPTVVGIIGVRGK